MVINCSICKLTDQVASADNPTICAACSVEYEAIKFGYAHSRREGIDSMSDSPFKEPLETIPGQPMYGESTPEERKQRAIFHSVVVILIVLFVAPLIFIGLYQAGYIQREQALDEQSATRDLKLDWFYRGVYAACVFDIVGNERPTQSVAAYCQDKIAQYRESHFDSFFDLPLGDESGSGRNRPPARLSAMGFASQLLSASAAPALIAARNYQASTPAISAVAFFGGTLFLSCCVIVLGVVMLRRGE